MQHFKFENWRIGGFEDSIVDVTNRLIITRSNPFLVSKKENFASIGLVITRQLSKI
jgi:hypothetical protein